ncbi:TAXI family TRAP transporter solute-binding subunit [Halomonas sp. BMC6]|uniref:TAXI family TRAP transporter solute-binding subunit n=1 Tax=Halomonas sp. BMC6 TaxID=3073244 RepID=UPI0030D48E86
MKKLTIAMAVAAALSCSAAAYAKDVVITAGVQGGTYHDVYGVNLTNILREQRISAEVQASRGSVENLERINAGDADVGFTQADALAAFLRSNPTAHLEIVGALGQECVYMAAQKDGKVEDDDDLGEEGVRVAIGERGTGSAESWGFMRTLEPDYQEASVYYQGGIRTLAQVKTGQMDAFMWVTSPDNRNHRFFEAVMQPDSGLVMIDVDSRKLRGELPNGEAVYTLRDVTIAEGFLSDTEVRVPCTDVLVVARGDMEDVAIEAVATAVMMNTNRIRGK